MIRILFVDDEQNVLQGLKRMLHARRSEWEMAFAQSGDAALTILEVTPFDVIVSDMRMPGMDGATLLACVRERYPHVIRIILSGHADADAAFRAVPVAHQFLAKPCDPGSLQVAVERAFGLKKVLNDESLSRTVGSLDELPALPRSCAALTKSLSDPDVSLNDVAGIVEQDVAIATKVLQLVNSAFFGLAHEISSVRTAVSYLGVDVLKGLVLSIGVFRACGQVNVTGGFSLEQLQAHAFLTAQVAGSLPVAKHLRETTVLAALLHDVGKLILAARMPAHLARVLGAARERQQPLFDVERELMGVTHAEIGAYLLGLWALPWAVVEAVAHHHEPTRVPQQGFDSLAAVHIANILAAECHGAPEAEERVVKPALDPAYLDLLGVTDELPEWRTQAQEVCDKLGRVQNAGS